MKEWSLRSCHILLHLEHLPLTLFSHAARCLINSWSPWQVVKRAHGSLFLCGSTMSSGPTLVQPSVQMCSRQLIASLSCVYSLCSSLCLLVLFFLCFSWHEKNKGPKLICMGMYVNEIENFVTLWLHAPTLPHRWTAGPRARGRDRGPARTSSLRSSLRPWSCYRPASCTGGGDPGRCTAWRAGANPPHSPGSAVRRAPWCISASAVGSSTRVPAPTGGCRTSPSRLPCTCMHKIHSSSAYSKSKVVTVFFSFIPFFLRGWWVILL